METGVSLTLNRFCFTEYTPAVMRAVTAEVILLSSIAGNIFWKRESLKWLHVHEKTECALLGRSPQPLG